MKNWKKNLMAAAVLLVVCVGIYTNWMYSNTQAAGNLTDYLDSDKVLSNNGIVMMMKRFWEAKATQSVITLRQFVFLDRKLATAQ